MTVADLQQLVEHDSWTPTNLNALPDTPAIEPTLGNTGLLYPGKRHVFSGPPESAKTLAAYAALIVVAQHAPTILIDFEMGARDAKKRLEELGANNETLNRIAYLEPDEPATPVRLANLVSLQPQLVVIDAAAGAYQIEGYDDNKRADVERFSRLYVGAFWLAGIATIVIDHVVKSVEGRGKFVIGSERKLGSSDVHLGFDTIQPVNRGSSGRYKITTHKDRGGCLRRGHIADLELDSDPDTHQIAWQFTVPQATDDEGYFRPTHLMEKVSIDLEHRPEPAPANAICEALGGRKQFVLKAINALLREGFVSEEAGPNRSRLLTSTKQFRENAAEPTSENGSTMRPEPLVLFSSAATTRPPHDLAQPSRSSVVPGSSHVVPGTTVGSGGSVVPPLTGGHHRTPPTPDHPIEQGWFQGNGTLLDGYFDEIAPDPDEDPRP